MTSSREIDYSDHPPATVSSESVDRQKRRDPCGKDHHPAIVSSDGGNPCSSETSEELLNKPIKIPKPNKNEDHDRERGDLFNSDILEWLKEFKENLVDDRVPGRRDSHASSSHGLSLEPTRSAELGKHSVYTDFPKD